MSNKYAGSIMKLTDSRIKQICSKAGIKTVNHLVYEEIRGILKVFVENFLEKILILTKYYERDTVTVNDVQMAEENHLILSHKKIPKCKNTNKIQICLEFPKPSFEKFIREISHDTDPTIKGFEKRALDIIQYYTEQYLLKILKAGRKAMAHAKRNSLQPRDLKLVLENCEFHD
jgi:histone H3/H4